MEPSETGYRGAASWKLDKEHAAPVSHQLCGSVQRPSAHPDNCNYRKHYDITYCFSVFLILTSIIEHLRGVFLLYPSLENVLLHLSVDKLANNRITLLTPVGKIPFRSNLQLFGTDVDVGRTCKLCTEVSRSRIKLRPFSITIYVHSSPKFFKLSPLPFINLAERVLKIPEYIFLYLN